MSGNYSFFIAPAPLFDSKTQETALLQRRDDVSRCSQLVGMIARGDYAVVKGSSESMEDVTRVSHFVGRSEEERGEEERSGCQESGSCCLPAADQSDDL